jgi:hypothetical protein
MRHAESESFRSRCVSSCGAQAAIVADPASAPRSLFVSSIALDLLIVSHRNACTFPSLPRLLLWLPGGRTSRAPHAAYHS